MQLREFDLQTSFAAARPAREDVENELGAVEDLFRGDGLEIAALRGGKFVVENDRARAGLGAEHGDLLGFAFADIIRGGRVG